MSTVQNLPQRPLISFVITYYNIGADLLRECIGSILSLSLAKEEREIIVVDDGSHLNPLAELGELLNQIVYIRQSNQGLSLARNMGLCCATGHFIQFVDGDDYLIKPPYEHCLDIARYQKADIILFHQTQKKHPEVPLDFEGPVSGATYMHQNNLRASACGYLFRRDILGSLRFSQGILHEDEEFTPQLMLRAEHVWSTMAKAYFYRKREGSIMETHDESHIDKRLTDMVDIILHLKRLADSSPEIDRVALNRRIAQLSADYLYNTIKLTHSRQRLEEAIDTLRQHGLYPLPEKRYTARYATFRWLISHSAGRKMLLAAIR